MASMPVQGTPSSFFKAWGQRGSERVHRPYTLWGVPCCASLSEPPPPAVPRGRCPRDHSVTEAASQLEFSGCLSEAAHHSQDKGPHKGLSPPDTQAPPVIPPLPSLPTQDARPSAGTWGTATRPWAPS